MSVGELRYILGKLCDENESAADWSVAVESGNGPDTFGVVLDKRAKLVTFDVFEDDGTVVDD